MKLLSLQTLISATLLALASHSLAVAATPSGSAMAEMSSFEGVVESERQTVMAAQVSGAVTEIAVKVGQSVHSGQVLMRLDARSANQSAVASEARLNATRLGRQVGDRSTLDLLNAENDAANARLSLLQARIALIMDRLRLWSLTGQLDEAQLQQVNRVLQK